MLYRLDVRDRGLWRLVASYLILLDCVLKLCSNSIVVLVFVYKLASVPRFSYNDHDPIVTTAVETVESSSMIVLVLEDEIRIILSFKFSTIQLSC